MTVTKPCHAVAVIGGACAGSVLADMLARSGCMVAVFEQNARPYGKIEDGLPRWHMKQRRMEYGKIDERLDQPNVLYVPNTRLGADLDFQDLATRWGWSAVVLANGAWKDRPLDARGADECEGRGLIYQNAFVYWFNHKNEASYSGPRFEVEDGAVVVGGGLASIDVIKIIQLELYERALRARGVAVDMHEMEEEGIPKYLAKRGIEDPASLGIRGGLLVYRRRIEDMPLANPPANATPKQVEKIAQVRQKLLQKCQEKFLFQVRPQAVTKELVMEDGRLAGVVLQATRVEGRNAVPIEGSEELVRSGQVISSIGSIPEVIPGIEVKGTYYRFKDWDTGEYEPIPGVFACGNVITGQGNIKASLDHGKFVATHLIERYLGVVEDRDIGQAIAMAEAPGARAAEAVAQHLERKPCLTAAQAEALLERCRARQREVGYPGNYREWLAKVTPPDME